MSIKFKHGDTIIEVVFAITIFALISVITVALMSAGLSTAQASLELSMTRSEMDGQANAIRFIHNSFLSEREIPISSQEYRALWTKLSRDSDAATNTGLVNKPENLPALAVDSCAVPYSTDAGGIKNSNLTAFVVNTRLLYGATSYTTDELNQLFVGTKTYPDKFSETQLYPRIIYQQNKSTAGGAVDSSENSDDELSESGLYRYIARAEGIWIIAVKDSTNSNHTIPEFYDFHIRTCWIAPGRDRPTTIGTIIRLYNPELVEAL